MLTKSLLVKILKANLVSASRAIHHPLLSNELQRNIIFKEMYRILVTCQSIVHMLDTECVFNLLTSAFAFKF